MIWRDSPPYLGDTHWALRHIFVLPMAASFKLFGANEFTATLPNIVYAGGLVAITFYFARKYVGLSEAVFASVLVSTSAFLVSKPLEIAIYGPEVFSAPLQAGWSSRPKTNAEGYSFLPLRGFGRIRLDPA